MNISFLGTVFWLMSCVVAFTYLGYPLWMLVQGKLRARPLQSRPQTPPLDLLLVVHNGAAQLAAKLDNLAALDYPAGQLGIHVICDGCTDESEAIARQHPSGVHVHAFSERRGKSACLGAVLPRLDAELVMFNDVRQRIDPAAARALVSVLADPGVGAASGELVLETRSGYAAGVDAYWRYEKLIRRMESASGSLVGVTGALYAAKRKLIPQVPAGVILDDMWIPLNIASTGHRVVFVPEALAYDLASSDAAAEEQRKRRTLAGNFQLIHQQPALAIPGAHPLALRLWGHKWLRLIAPWLLLGMLACNVWLAMHGSLPYQLLLLAQIIAYATALLGLFRPAFASRHLPVRLAAAFFSLNSSALLALLDYLRNPDAHLWQTTRMEDAS